ncbi:catalase [Psychromonas sp. psych-6C06]|uniref:putative metalloprotease CJM1_0395 family protein n=1 Tax=Psychromonas sp. psych-6C06 TaxID=2058089 RepID=UPI000C338762|nr:putative metalloprotease CJM1_0395 family protein [Psychromonas sp. psych-6C06]PKF63556.1 catalase [Psychromonas sp. psych-6C06]
MNISSAQQLATQIHTPLNVGGESATKTSVSTGIERNTSINADISSDSISSDNISSDNISSDNISTTPTVTSDVNPTYERPQIPALNDEAKQQDSQPSEDDEEGNAPVSDTDISDPQAKQKGEIYTEAELKLIDSLQQRDTEVIAHERAHAAVGGQHTGTPSYSYKTGPDGVKYAVSGEVSIDTSPVPGDPQATLQKAQQIKAAALAPAEPSAQDRKVAAKAMQMASEARSEIVANNQGDEDKSRSTASYSNGNIPERFSEQQHLSINNNDIDELKMNKRNFHINDVYQSSSQVNADSRLNILV